MPHRITTRPGSPSNRNLVSSVKLATLAFAFLTIYAQAQLPTFRAWMEEEPEGKVILSWTTGPYRQYEVQRSNDLFDWSTEALLYRTTGDSHMRRHVLTIVSPGATPTPVIPPPTKESVLFTLRKIGADYIAVWQGLDGTMYTSGPVSGVPAAALPLSERDSGNYKITTLVAAPAAAGVLAPPPSVLPSAESARLSAFTAIVSDLGTTDAPVGMSALVSTSGTYWRVREIQDSDGDGLTDYYEATVLQTDSFLWDSDGDGTDDGTENAMGRSALDATDAQPATFTLDWQQFAGLSIQAHGYKSGLIPSAPFNLYRKRVTTKGRRKNQTSYPNPAVPTLNTRTRDDFDYNLVEEITGNGALHFEVGTDSHEPTIRWNFSHTRGADLPTANTALFGLPTAPPLVSGDRYQFSGSSYGGAWNYESGTLTNHILTSFREWPESAGQIVTQKRREWTASSSTSISVTSTTTHQRTIGTISLLPSDAPALLWTTLTSATAGSPTTSPNQGWQTIVLSDPVTYSSQRANVIALNYSGAGVVTNDNDDLASGGDQSADYSQSLDGTVALRQFSFRFRRSNTNASAGGEPFSGATSVRWTETFTPSDDPATSDVNEAVGLSETRHYTWSAVRGATASPTIVINPALGRFSGGPTGSDKGGISLGTTTVSQTSVEVMLVDPSDSTWTTTQEESRVILDDEPIKIRAVIKEKTLQSLAQLQQLGLSSISIATFATAPQSVNVPLNSSNTQLVPHLDSGDTELQISLTYEHRRAANLIPQVKLDQTLERAAYDIIHDGRSDSRDGMAFIIHPFEWLSHYRHFANSEKNSSLLKATPDADISTSALKAAGAERVLVKFGPAETRGLCMNQADCFYYSGHGHSISRDPQDVTQRPYPALQGSNGRHVRSKDLAPYWLGDLDTVIIAGCSVLNINNLSPNASLASNPLYPSYYPGIEMEKLGPSTLLGYGASTPTDISGRPLRVISDFLDESDSGNNKALLIWAWKYANAKWLLYDAVAIEKGVKYCYFEKSEILGIPFYNWQELPKSSW